MSFFIDREEKREGKQEEVDAGRKGALSRALTHGIRGRESVCKLWGSDTCPFSYSGRDDNLTTIKKRLLGLKLQKCKKM